MLRKNHLRLLLLVIVIFTFSHPTVEALQTCERELLCTVDKVWTGDDLLSQIDALEPGDYTFIVGEDELTFVYHRPQDSEARLSLLWTSVELPLNRVENSNYWTVTVELADVNAAIVTFGLLDSTRVEYPLTTFRGPDTDPFPPENEELAGEIKTRWFESEALGRGRDIYIYLPPDHDASNEYLTIYLADGTLVNVFAGGIDYMITVNMIPPVIIVGIGAAQSTNERNFRGEEYVIGRNPELFENHAQFFTEEVRLWAEETFGAATYRNMRGIAGVSNGALFAITINVQHPDLYGFVFAFSAGASTGFEDSIVVDEDTVQLPLFVYSSAGTLEPPFLETTQAFTEAYHEAGATTQFSRNVAGHDDVVWNMEFSNALQWLFEQQSLTE